MHNFSRRSALIVALFAALPWIEARSQGPSPAKHRNTFMVVVRESIGANRQSDTLVPTGKATAKLPDGREVEIETASWEYIGDTHIRFVFDGEQTMVNATPEDLKQLGLNTVEEALQLALENIKRAYGAPSATRVDGAVMQVAGKSPDLNSSYFLDRHFWQELANKHPDGIVVSVPARGSLVYVPASEAKYVELMKTAAPRWYANAQRLRVSSALFLFKEGKWSVLLSPRPR
jgi:uncharacterized protein YtpQ (UPF0354 family)